MISKFFTTTFTVNRSVWSTDVNGFQSSEESVVGTFKGHLQQLTAEQALNLGLNFTTPFSVWCPTGTNVIIGDNLTANSVNYTIRAIQNNGLVGVNKHLQLYVELNKNE